MTGQRDLISKFLQFKRIAVVGVSHHPTDFTRTLWKEFRARGYDAVPVHPVQQEIDGVRCYPTVRDIVPPVEAALILVPKERIGGVINDCAASGVHTVWVYGIRGRKDVPVKVIQHCEEYGIELVAGYCPLMFLPETALFHRIHTFGAKVFGQYPK